jgi:hypothetical protein
VVRTYVYDTAGRLSEDQATAPGGWGDVSHAIVDIVTAYDDLGRVETVTSYADTSKTTAVNQVQYVYDGWGNVYRGETRGDILLYLTK